MDRSEAESYIVMFAILTLFWIVLPEVSAHELIAVEPENTMFQSSVIFPNPFTESYFTLEHFDREGQSHWYSFNGIEGEQVIIQTLVPDMEGTNNITPCFDLLIGEDKVTPDQQKTRYVEDFSNTNWFVTCEVNMILPDDGVYFIRAHDDLGHYSVGDTGKFSLAFGVEEDFSIIDWIFAPLWILQINSFFENNVFVWIILVLVFVLVVIILFSLKKKNKLD